MGFNIDLPLGDNERAEEFREATKEAFAHRGLPPDCLLPYCVGIALAAGDGLCYLLRASGLTERQAEHLVDETIFSSLSQLCDILRKESGGQMIYGEDDPC